MQPSQNPATMTNDQLLGELAELGKWLTKADGQSWELEARQWRLRAELKFRESNGENHGCCG
jgi:hypothetical protein